MSKKIAVGVTKAILSGTKRILHERKHKSQGSWSMHDRKKSKTYAWEPVAHYTFPDVVNKGTLSRSRQAINV